MPVSEISKGVFIVAPRDLPKYKDTAAGEYTSVFTKQRANQWEMAQKQALMNMELGTKRYAEEMKTYRERLSALDDRQKELEGLKVRVAEGQLKAEDAAAIVALRESGSRQRTLADNAAKQAAVGVTSAGGSSSTVGGGRKAPDPTAVGSTNETELGLAKAEAPPSAPSALATAVRARLNDGRLSAGTAAESDAVKYNAVNEMVEDETARQLTSNPSKSYDDARADAISIVEPQLGTTDRDFFDAYERIEGQIDAADTAAGTPRVTTSTRETKFFEKYPKLGGVPDAPDVPRPEVADRQPVIQDINEFINNLEMAKQGIDRPALGGTDFITDSRDIMRGRFGGFSGAADALPYEQRNVVERLIKDPAYGLSAIEGYRDYLAKQRAEAATAARFRESMAEGPANTSVEALRSTPGTPPPTSADIPVAPVSVAPVEPPPPAQSVPEAVAEAPVALRPEAADLMTPVERAEFYERLRASADVRQLRKDMSAIDTGGTEINPDFQTPLTPPPVLARPALSTMSAPQQIAASFDPQFAVPRTPAPPPPPLGAKEEGPLVVASPAMAPSTSGAAPRGPADVSAAVRPAGPLAGKLPYQIKDETERFAKSTEMADDVRKATKAGLGTVGSQFGIKKGGPPSTVGYFQNRAEVALELKDKRGKLDRIASSGAGKVAKDLWGQNSKLGKPFENTWQEIQMTFAGDQKSLETAHEVALAYDIIAKEDKAPLKQSPK